MELSSLGGIFMKLIVIQCSKGLFANAGRYWQYCERICACACMFISASVWPCSSCQIPYSSVCIGLHCDTALPYVHFIHNHTRSERDLVIPREVRLLGTRTLQGECSEKAQRVIGGTKRHTGRTRRKPGLPLIVCLRENPRLLKQMTSQTQQTIWGRLSNGAGRLFGK